MYCRSCGVWNDEGRPGCSACGKVLNPLAADTEIRGSSHLAAAIAATLLCCLPFGVVAIVFAAQIDTKLHAGDVEGARASATQARLWTWIAFGSGLAAVLVYGALVASGMFTAVLKH